MKSEQVHTVILGAGPAGLAAGYTLAKAGLKPVLLERDAVSGGLMRSIKKNDFVLDVGRKELYNRLEKVDQFWGELLGSDYRPYDHRGGVLYDGVIFDQSPQYTGFRRGMPWPMFLACLWDFASAQLTPKFSTPRNVEEYFYQRRGKRLTKAVSQGFQEKLTGRRWAEIPMPERRDNGTEPGLLETLKGAFIRTFSSREVNTHKNVWRHPAKGTGQICEALDRGIREHGGRIFHNARIQAITREDNRIRGVIAEVNGEQVQFDTDHLVSSIPIEALVHFVLDRQVDKDPTRDVASPFRRKTVVIVYLFLNEPPRFPHAWLIVTCPKTRIGRITNYAGFNGDMVPLGKGALCFEYYCFDDEDMLKLTNQEFAELALKECAQYKLADASKCFDTMVLRFPGADASQNRHNWLNKIRLGFLEDLKSFNNLYYVSRTDLDIATLAGIESAEAIISGDRMPFDHHIDPTQIGIRSTKKAFEFKLPEEA
jgi:protoporphyrinogen oxidase